MMSFKVTFAGAIPFKTYKFNPTGGVIVAISKFSRTTIPNHKRSNPSCFTMGRKIGIVTNKIEPGSMRHPRKNMVSIIAAKISHLEMVSDITHSARFDVKPT